MPQTVLTGAVVVVNYASSSLIVENLVPLRRALPPEVGVVVVDNFSTDAERAAIGRVSDAAGLTLVGLDVNGGFGAGVTAGVDAAVSMGADALVVLNPDAVADASTVLEMLRLVREDRNTMIAPVIRRSDGTVWFDGSDLHLADGRIKASRRRTPGDDVFAWLSGACIALSVDLWQRSGGFDDDYFLYWEDVDLSWRVARAGGRLAVVRELVVVHDEGGTQTSRRSVSAGAKSTLYYYYNVRNRFLFAAKNLDDAALARWLDSADAVAREIVLQGGRRQFLRHPIAPWSAMRRGLRDGRAVARERLAGAPSREG